MQHGGLLRVLRAWLQETRWTPAAVRELGSDAAGQAAEAGQANLKARISLPAGCYLPARKWQGAEYKLPKSGKKPNWEMSWERFSAGEDASTIAVTQASGQGKPAKAIQKNTVIGHVRPHAACRSKGLQHPPLPCPPLSPSLVRCTASSALACFSSEARRGPLFVWVPCSPTFPNHPLCPHVVWSRC